MTISTLTEAQFQVAQDAVDAAIRASRRGTPERAAAEAVSADWEAVLALPQATAAQRESRRAAIAAVASCRRLLAVAS
jgi:hypothetical protein